jgi:hypothetical protein
MANLGEVHLEMSEEQSGTHLGKGDIVQLEIVDLSQLRCGPEWHALILL